MKKILSSIFIVFFLFQNIGFCSFRKTNYWGKKQPPVGVLLDTGDSINFGLIEFWLFNERGGMIAVDSARKNNGTLVGPVSVPGCFGGTLKFDGSTNYITAGDFGYANFSSAGTFSISAWIKPTASATGSIIYSDSWIGSALNNGFIFYVAATNTLKFYVSTAGSGGTFDFAASNSNVVDGNWHHVVMTYNNRVVNFYRDSVSDGGGTVTLNVNATLTTAGFPTVLGANNNTGSSDYINFYTGNFDNVRVYNRILMPQEIARLFSQPFAGLLPSQIDLMQQPVTTVTITPFRTLMGIGQ